MPDKIELLVGGKRIEHFKSFSISSDLYSAANSFDLDLSQTDLAVNEGDRCQLFVNDSLELSGIIDRVERQYEKRNFSLTIHGRDFMGLLVDSAVEEYIDLGNITLKTLATKLMAKVPFVNIKAIKYGNGLQPADTEDEVMKANPGDSIFDVLKRFAAARDLLFYCLPNGQFVFERPKKSGKPIYHIRISKDGIGNNAKKGTFAKDISRRSSKVIVIGQQDGGNGSDGDDFNIDGVRTDKTFPFHKPHVFVLDHSAGSATHFAKLIMEKERADGFELSYEVQGFTQGGRNFAINQFCEVYDEAFDLNDVYLIYSRTFSRDKQGGSYSSLRLGPAGLLQ